MHRALYVEEILRQIFAYFLPQPVLSLSESLGEHFSRRDVIALARTCETFKEPALDILWEELPNLTPLVRCLPEASSVNSVGVRSFRYLDEKMVIELSADVLI